MEADFGITQFTNTNPGFSGVLKQRYQDFIVHEIDEEGTVVVLTEFNVTGGERSAASIVCGDEGFAFSVETEEKLKNLELEKQGEVSINCQNLDKSERTKIHEAIRRKFSNLESKTGVKDGISVINVTYSKNSTRKRTFWPADRGDYCKFVLYKENKDSGLVTSLIAKFLNVKQISVAGTKDRRAITSQLATVYRIDVERVAKLNERLREIRVGNFRYCQNELRLGALQGNRFTIVLRNVNADEGVIENGVKELQKNGFVNYYGTQRFGTSAIATHSIGKAILQKKWAEATNLILAKRDYAFPHLEKCYDVWATTKDASQAYDSIPPSKRDTCVEGMLLKALKKLGMKDFASSFRAIPRNTRNLYVHSFQSLLWNKLVSKRIAALGYCKVLLGDFVLKDRNNSNEEIFDSNDCNLTNVVTETNLKDANIFDVVVPLFSTRDCLPKNEMADWYDDLLNEENVTWEQLKDCSKEYALHGGLRRLLIKPGEMKFELLRYDDPNEPLTLSDLDVIEGKTGGKYLALKLEFSLPSGSYATMLLRELTKCDSSKFYQASLNDYAKSTVEDNNDDKEEETNV